MEPNDLTAWRGWHRLSRNSAATALGVSGTTVAAWECGEAAIPMATVYACAYLHEHPELMGALEPQDHARRISQAVAARAFRQHVGSGRVAGVVEIGLANSILAQKLIERLLVLRVIAATDVIAIFQDAIDHNDDHTAIGQPWTGGVVGYLERLRRDVVRRLRRDQASVVETPAADRGGGMAER
jgi:DNA-binding XRE family transcriptional regulator